MNAATNQPSILTLRLGQSNQAGQTHTCHSDEGSALCSDFGECRTYKSSLQYTHLYTIISTINET